MSYLRPLFLLTLSGIMFFSCKKKEDNKTASFDRQALLVNYSDNIILPAIDDFSQKTTVLSQVAGDLSNNVDSVAIVSIRERLQEAWLAYQWIAPLEFGPGEEVSLRFMADIFPSDTNLIENNIATGGYDLNTIGNAPARGFPALDYLVFRGSVMKVVSDMSDSARVQYVIDVTDQLQLLGTSLQNKWQTYRETFVNSLGVDVGSSLGLFVNAYNKAHEVSKNARVGIPLGKRSLGQPYPEKVEAYFSGFSRQLLRENMEAELAFFNGTSFKTGENGVGLDDYLNTLEARHGTDLLTDVIRDQFAQILTAEADLTVSLQEAISVENAKVENLYQAMQKQVIYLKTDMPSVLGIQITYQDNDGD